MAEEEPMPEIEPGEDTGSPLKPIDEPDGAAGSSENASNTVADDSQPDVIGSYTDNSPQDREGDAPKVEEDNSAVEGEEAEPASRPASGVPAAGSRPVSAAFEAGQGEGAATEGGEATEAPHTEGTTADAETGTDAPTAEAGEGTDDSAEVGAGHELPADGEAPAPVEPADEGEAPVAEGDAAVADAAADFPGGEPEAEAPAEEGEAAAESEAPAEGEAAAEGEAPAEGGVAEEEAALTAAAVAGGSRTGSVSGSRPPSQPTGSRPTSAQQAGSRSQSQTSSRPLSQAGSMSVQGVPAASGSRPTSQQASREGSASGPRASSRQGSAAGSQHGSQAGSRQDSLAGSRQGSQAGSQQSSMAPSRSGSASGAPPGAGSRPASAQQASPLGEVAEEHARPASGGADADAGASSSRPTSAAGEQPASRQASAASRGRGDAAAHVPPPAEESTAPAPPPPAENHNQVQTQADPQLQSPAPEHYLAQGVRAIDVEVDQGPGLPHKLISVLLDYTQMYKKPYIGGYKNKKTQAMFHHAVTQTPRAPKFANAERKLERETQTVKISSRSAMTQREAATQMERPGVILDTSEDRVKTPGPYQTSEVRLAIVTKATKVIQRFIRGYLGRKRADYLKEKKREREAFLLEQELKAQKEAEEHRHKEIERRMHPRTAADFEILYNELEAWRLQETRRIKEAGLPKEKEHEVLQQLLHKETKLLQTIDRLKINANHENKDLRIQRTLGDMGKPKQMELKNGAKVEVHTPFTTRAKELQQLYNGLNLPMLSIDERLDVLLHVKWTVKEFDCNLTREIVELIDREADLLNRGRAPKMLEGLRKRISGLFLNFIETEEFNPQAAVHKVIPMNFEQYMFEKLEKSSARAPVITMKTTDKWDL